MCTRKPRLVLLSLLIGWKNGARTLNQSLREVKPKIIRYFRHSIANPNISNAMANDSSKTPLKVYSNLNWVRFKMATLTTVQQVKLSLIHARNNLPLLLDGRTWDPLPQGHCHYLRLCQLHCNLHLPILNTKLTHILSILELNFIGKYYNRRRSHKGALRQRTQQDIPQLKLSSYSKHYVLTQFLCQHAQTISQ